MKTANISLGTEKHPIFVARGLKGLSNRLSKYRLSKIGIVTNKKIGHLHLRGLLAELKKTRLSVEVFYLPEGEQHKSIRAASALYPKLLSARFDRHSALLAFGGGVIGDICGFVASTYMRGISFFQLPTTLLAQVDAAIGGKTAVNLPQAKNAVGTFYQPKFVWSNVEFLKTLPKKEWLNGLAETIKYGVIMDEGFFRFLQNGFDIDKPDPAKLERIVFTSACCKARVVSRDEKETSGLRQILNFGHTFGHILEVYYGYNKMSHGQAVSIGMVFAARLAEKLGIFKRACELEGLLRRYELPVSLPSPLKGRLWKKVLYSDKKFVSGINRFVLPVKIGAVRIVDNVDMKLIAEVMEEMNAESKSRGGG